MKLAESSDHTSHYGYSTAETPTPIPAPADHQTPILRRLEEEAYPLQMELAETRRQLHACYFVEVQTPQADNSQPALRRLMVTEVDRRGPSKQAAGVLLQWDHRPHTCRSTVGLTLGINPPNLPTTGDGISKFQKYPRMEIHHKAQESPVSVQGSGMDDSDSIAANVDITPPPVQIQLATFFWNILNSDQDANMGILERLEDPDDDLTRHLIELLRNASYVQKHFS